MRVLFCMGEKSADGRVFVRPSARCIAIEGDRVAMVHSLQYDYYKFPGGGIEPQETREQALVRETQVSCRPWLMKAIISFLRVSG